jgi:hypothetical protein
MGLAVRGTNAEGARPSPGRRQAEILERGFNVSLRWAWTMNRKR